MGFDVRGAIGRMRLARRRVVMRMMPTRSRRRTSLASTDRRNAGPSACEHRDIDSRLGELSVDLFAVGGGVPPPPGLMFDRIGGRTRTRTLDPLIKSQLLYQLSYAC